jgi:hypothetical protein
LKRSENPFISIVVHTAVEFDSRITPYTEAIGDGWRRFVPNVHPTQLRVCGPFDPAPLSAVIVVAVCTFMCRVYRIRSSPIGFDKDADDRKLFAYHIFDFSCMHYEQGVSVSVSAAALLETRNIKKINKLKKINKMKINGHQLSETSHSSISTWMIIGMG